MGLRDTIAEHFRFEADGAALLAAAVVLKTGGFAGATVTLASGVACEM
jgi:hypothetical protein